jgi:pilus assembly protein CpaC
MHTAIVRHLCACTTAAVALVSTSVALRAQVPDVITPIELAVGRSLPLSVAGAVSKVSIANPDVADVVVVSTGELVINARAAGETDAIVWEEGGGRQHYRVVVATSSQRKQVLVAIKFAEVAKTFLADFGTSGIYTDANNQVGSNAFVSGIPTSTATSGAATSSQIALPTGDFLSVLTNFNTKSLLGLLETQEQKGLARSLAEPNLLAGNKQDANFLAGGEVPIPVVQSGASAGTTAPITIVYKEYGVKLHVMPEILNDSLVRLTMTPEVSALDYSNAVTISGFSIPALTTQRVQSTVDVKRGQSLIISGMFDDVWSRTKTGIPLLMDIPILGTLFASNKWQHNQTELLVVVTPTIVDPLAAPASVVLPLKPDTTLPARAAIKNKILTPPPGRQGAGPSH